MSTYYKFVKPAKIVGHQHPPASYTPLWIADAVPVGKLTRALTHAGLTLSNVPGVGLVIHEANSTNGR